jgi:hypothetical protein
MKIVSWRNLAVLLGVICCYQMWHGCNRSAAAKKASDDARAADCRTTIMSSSTGSTSSSSTAAATDRPSLAADTTPVSFHGFKAPAWVMQLAPQPGEKMRDYRDRILPLAQTVVAPQRSRVARTRDDFAALDSHQRAELDGAVQEAATAIEDRVMNGILSGELTPATFKPMTGVTMAREILDIIDRGNTRFMNSLTPDERTRLASHRFDFADYLLFSARWEDALKILD